MNKNRIIVNGVSIDVDGNHVSVHSGTVYVNDVSVCSVPDQEIHIYWHGELAELQANGPVNCGDVHGDVRANGYVICQDVAGEVKSNGKVKAARAYNNIRANGSVNINY